METLLAYLAGIIDGEAHVGVVKKGGSRSAFVMEVEMTNTRIPRLLQETFGGAIYSRDRSAQPGKEKHNRTWRWRVTHRLARAAYAQVEPYLRLKAGMLD